MLLIFENVGLYLWLRAWDIADRVFKLASWGLLIAAMVVVDSRNPTPEIRIAVSLLCVLWLAALIVSVVDAGKAFQDKCAEHIAVFRSRLLRLLLGLIVALAVTYSVVGFIRGATAVFTLILAVPIPTKP